MTVMLMLKGSLPTTIHRQYIDEARKSDPDNLGGKKRRNRKKNGLHSGIKDGLSERRTYQWVNCQNESLI